MQGHRSRTSDWVAALRALYTGAPAGLEIAPDPVAEALLPPLLALEVRALRRSPFVMRLGHRALGAVTRGLSYGIPLRTAAIDAAIRAGVGDGIRQLVVLGAGLDARAFRMGELHEAHVYELDHPLTQAYKRERILGRRPLARGHRLCAIDFERDRIGEVLGAAGFRADEPSFWLWEGVTMYLTPGAIDASLDAIAGASAPGSRLAMTYSARTGVPRWAWHTARAIAAGIGEPLHGPMSSPDVHARLGVRGFRVRSDDSAREWVRRYWPASEHHRAEAYERLVVAERHAQ